MDELQQARPRSGLRMSRLEALSDGVFAIAITLLVLNLLNLLPVVTQATPQVFERMVGQLLPALLVYVMSFLLVGFYWVGHHLMTNFIQRADRLFLWLNILFLMCIAFIPFPTALLAAFREVLRAELFAVRIYGVTLLLMGLMMAAMWWYASHDYRLVAHDLHPELIRNQQRRTITGALVYLVALLLSVVSPVLSLAVYVIFPIIYLLPARVDQFVAGLRPTRRDPGEVAALPATDRSGGRDGNMASRP